MLLRFLIALVFCFWALVPAVAEDDVAHHTQARMYSSVKGVDQLKTVPVGIEVKLEPGWKSYWRTPGEAGLPPAFDWTGSENFKEAKISWPAPKRYTALDIENFGYEGDITFPVDITPEIPGKAISLRLKLDLLICSTLCVPETQRLSLTIPGGEAQVSDEQALLAAALEKIPSTGGEDKFSVQNVWLDEEGGKRINIHVNALASEAFPPETDFFVEHPSYITTDKPVFGYDPGTKKLRIDARVRAYEPLETLQRNLKKSPLTLTIVSPGRTFERQAELSMPQAPKGPLSTKFLQETKEHADPLILLLAFLGGLILNLMPCVLPVLSLKILSVLSHGGKDHRIHRWTIFKNFMASAAGILFSFWILAAALIVLKSAGQTIGWGIQFQHPGFLLFLIVILTLFAANMWDMFEIPLPRFMAKNIPAHHEHEPTLLGHFLTGAFATLLATPCTAPFLGTAVGFALARGAVDILVVFTFLALGLAFPYILLALSPRIFKYMPKPGAWMLVLKKALGLALALTASWLLSVMITISTQPTLDDGWTKFDEALIQPAVSEGKTVIVDVTADWCLTCKANKRLVLEQKDIMEALSGPNILRLQADWTHRDEAVAAYLKKYGRYGIPFNIIYGPAAPQGIILSELLTKKDVMRALSEAAGE